MNYSCSRELLQIPQLPEVHTASSDCSLDLWFRLRRPRIGLKKSPLAPLEKIPQTYPPEPTFSQIPVIISCEYFSESFPVHLVLSHFVSNPSATPWNIPWDCPEGIPSPRGVLYLQLLLTSFHIIPGHLKYPWFIRPQKISTLLGPLLVLTS